MIQIRFAEPQDIPGILKVLKSALGDPHGRRNPNHWKWKHLDNPFGPSAVMLAFVGNDLVGVRAMMQWEFCMGNKLIRAWRATDTATAPGHQRSGVFSHLTSAMIAHLAGLGVGFVFNTPNPVSAQGYFKLGWVSAGRTATLVKPCFKGLILNRFTKTEPKHENLMRLPDQDLLLRHHQLFSDQLITNWSPERLDWRYRQVPDLTYHSIETTNGSIIFRKINRGYLRELRITEIFPVHPDLKLDIERLIKDQRPDLVTVLEDGQGVMRRFLPSGFFNLKFRSPHVVCRRLNDQDQLKDFQNEKSRYFSGGTLELF